MQNWWLNGQLQLKLIKVLFSAFDRNERRTSYGCQKGFEEHQVAK